MPRPDERGHRAHPPSAATDADRAHRAQNPSSAPGVPCNIPKLRPSRCDVRAGAERPRSSLAASVVDRSQLSTLGVG